MQTAHRGYHCLREALASGVEVKVNDASVQFDCALGVKT